MNWFVWMLKWCNARKGVLSYRAVCGCLAYHSHTRQEWMTGSFQAKEIENYGHPHQDSISLANVHLPQVAVISHLPPTEVLKKKNTFGILNSHCLWQFYLLFPPLYCHRTTSLKPSYVTDLFSFHQITWASSGTNSATLKMEAVCSSKMAEHLSLHSSETRRQQSVHMPWKPANVHQVTRI
jgi:hypothetical protein